MVSAKPTCQSVLLHWKQQIVFVFCAGWVIFYYYNTQPSEISVKDIHRRTSPVHYQRWIQPKHAFLDKQHNKSDQDNILSQGFVEIRNPTQSVSHEESKQVTNITTAPKSTIISVNASQPPSSEAENSTQYPGVFDFENSKKILFFTKYFDIKGWQFGFGHEPFLKFGCPVTNCYVTDNKSLIALEEFDAVLFHMRDMNAKKLVVPNQKKRKAKQRYVMFLMESPLNDGFNYKKLANFFNWTMTYRQDSDFPRPYGWISSKTDEFMYPPSESEKWRPYIAASVNRTFLDQFRRSRPENTTKVAWVVSNCGTHSKREAYVNELKKYIDVDVFGACGKKKCDRKDGNACLKFLEENYMFYLSFENSLCNDYVTEKFWKILQRAMIPVVMGGADYARLAPPHSYINAVDKTPEELARILKELIDDQDEYMSYFWWKEHYQVFQPLNIYGGRSICQLCERLNDPNTPDKVYADIHEWWRGKGDCKPSRSLPWSQFPPKVEKVSWIQGVVDGLGNWLESPSP